jgi:hypothetical protein
MQTKLSNLEATIDARPKWLARGSEAARALAATRVQEQHRDGTSRSCPGVTTLIDCVQVVPERDRWLGPIIALARSWQFRSRSTLAAVVGLAGVMAGPMRPAVEGDANGDVWTANFGASAYAFTPPSGFGNW